MCTSNPFSDPVQGNEAGLYEGRAQIPQVTAWSKAGSDMAFLAVATTSVRKAYTSGLKTMQFSGIPFVFLCVDPLPETSGRMEDILVTNS